VQGAGTTSEKQTYSESDQQPLRGYSYYRLKQTDFDGTFTYSPTEVVEFAQNSSVRIYPTQTTGTLTIEAQPEELQEVSIWNLHGQDIGHLVGLNAGNTSALVADLSNVPSGIYFVRTPNSITKVLKQ